MTQILYSYISEKNHEYLLKELLPEFSIDFRNRILKYRRWQDAQLSLLGRMLLSDAFKKLGKQFKEENLKYGPYNKPYFEDEKVRFNISHSGNIVVCILSEVCEVGIDIESIDSINIDDFKFQMTNLEIQRIIYSDNIKHAFFEYWTQKEAVLKACGKGLSIPLKSFEVNDSATINNETYYLREIKLDNNYKCHSAFKGKMNPIILDPQLINFIP